MLFSRQLTDQTLQQLRQHLLVYPVKHLTVYFDIRSLAAILFASTAYQLNVGRTVMLFEICLNKLEIFPVPPPETGTSHTNFDSRFHGKASSDQ